MRSRLRDRRVALFAASLFVLLVAEAYWYEPYLTNPRVIVTSTPSPFPRGDVTRVRVPPKKAACVDLVGLGAQSENAVIRLATRGRPPEPVAFELRGPGYRHRSVVRRYRSLEDVVIPIAPPPEDLLVEGCVRNLGDEPVFAVGSKEGGRVQSRSATRVDGEEIAADVGLVILEREPASLVARAGTIVERAAAWKPFGPALAWFVVVLVILVVPLGALGAFAWSTGREDEPAPRPRP